MLYRAFHIKYKKPMSKKVANVKAKKLAKEFQGKKLNKVLCITNENKSNMFLYIAIYY